MLAVIVALCCTISTVLANIDERPCILLPNGTKPADYYDKCSRCSAGQGMSLYCVIISNSSTNQHCFKNTLCSECVSGTYQDRKLHQDACKVCSFCDRQKGLMVLKSCTSVSNVVCGCAPGFYWNTLLDKCIQCTRCLAGSEPSECSTNTDTTCSRCQNGTFSDGQSSCKPCRTCNTNSGEIMESACTASSDTVCTQLQQLTPTVIVNDVNDWVIYLSCGMMMSIAFTAALYVVCKCCYYKKRTIKTSFISQLCVGSEKEEQNMNMQPHEVSNNATTVNFATEPDCKTAARAANGHAKSKVNRLCLDESDPTLTQVLINQGERTNT